MTLAALFGGVSTANPSWGLFILIFFLLAAFVYGPTLGRSRVIVLIISTYISLALMKSLPFLTTSPSTSVVDGNPLFIIQITAYLGIALLVFFFLSNAGLRKGLAHEDVAGNFFQTFLFSLGHAGLTVASVLSFLPQVSQAQLGPMGSVFVGQVAFTFWLLAPLLLMLLFKAEAEE